MNEQLLIEIGFGIKQAQQAAGILQGLIEDIAKQAQSAMKIGVDTGGLKQQLADVQSAISGIVGDKVVGVKVDDGDVKGAADNVKKKFDDVADSIGEEFKKTGKKAGDDVGDGLGQGAKTGEKFFRDSNGRLRDEFGRLAKEIEQKSSLFGKLFQFNQITQAFSTLSSAVQGLSSPFIELDTATQNLKTLGAEAAAMAPNLREAAIQMSKDLPFAAAELQTSMFDALASGVKGGEEGLKSFADTAARLAVGSGAELSESTGLLAANLNAYGKSAEDAGKFSDIFFNTINFGVTSAAELSSTLANVIPTAAAAGVELEGVGAALAVMTSKGVPTAQSTTKLNALLIEIQKPGAELAKVLKAAGVSMESLKQDDLPVTLAKIQQGLAATGKTATTAFSSSEAGAAFNVLAGDLEGFAQTFIDVRDTTGSAQFAYEQMADSVQTQTNQMMATVNAFIIEGLDVMGSGFVGIINIAGQLAPTLSTVASLGALLPEDAFKNFGATAKKVFFDVAEDGTKSFKGIGGTLSSVFGSLQGGISKLLPEGAFDSFSKSASAVFFKVGDDGKKSFKGLSTSLTSVVSLLQDGVAKGLSGIAGVAGSMKSVLVKALTAIIPGLFTVNAATGATTISFTAMWTAATGGVALLIAGLVAVGAYLTYFFTSTEKGKELFAALGDFIQDFVDRFKAGFAGLTTLFGGFIDGFGRLLSGDIVGAVSDFFGAFGDAADAEADSLVDSKLAHALDDLTDNIETTIEIQTKINTADSIPKLTEQLQKIQSNIGELELKVKAGTASEQDVAQLDSLKKKAAEVSDSIRAIAPAAEEGMRQVTLSTGEVITTYDIGIEKAKEYGKAQKEAFSADLTKNQKQFTEDLQGSIDAYSAQKDRLDELTEKLNAAKKAGDADAVADLKEQVAEFSDKVKTSRDEISKALTEGNAAGLLIPADIRVPDNAVNEFQTQLDVAAEEAKRKLREKQLGEAVTPVVEIKTKIAKAEGLPQLLKQLENAKTEAEKQSIARAIQEAAPDAVKAIGQVVNEEGKIVDVLEVNANAALASAEANKKRYGNDLAQAQAKFIDGVKQEGKVFKDNRAEAARLKAELEKAPKGANTDALQKQYRAVTKEVSAAAVQAAKFGAQSIAAGGDAEAAYTQVAEALGISKEEAVKLVAEQERINKAAAEGAKQVRNLAAEYNAAKQAAAALQSESEAAAATLEGDLRKLTGRNAAEAAATVTSILSAATPEQIAAATALVEKSGKAFRDQAAKDAAVAKQITETLINEQVKKQKDGYKSQLQLQKDFNKNSEAFKRDQTQKDIDGDLKAAQSALKEKLRDEESSRRKLGAATVAEQTKLEVDLLKIKQKYTKLDFEAQIDAAKRKRDFLKNNGGTGEEIEAANQAITDLNNALENSSEDTADAIAKVLRDARAKLVAEEEKRTKEELQRKIETKEREAAAIEGKDSESLKRRFEAEKELLDLKEDLAVESAQDNVKDIALIYQKFEKDREELAKKSEREIASALEDERIGAIKDGAERRRQFELKVASEAYDADLVAAGANELKKTEAFEKYIGERIAIQKRFDEAQGITFQSAAADALSTLRTAFSTFSIDVDSEGAEQAKTDIAAIREEQKKLYEEQARGSKSYQEVADEQEKLNERMTASMAQLGDSQTNFWRSFSDAAVAALNEVNKAFTDQMQKQIGVYFATDDTVTDLLEERGKLEQDLAKAVADDNVDAQKKIRDTIDATNEKITDSETKKQDALTEAYAATAASATTNFLAMTLAGENAGAALVKSALDGLQALVPILTAEIFGQAFGQLGPIGGAIAFAAVNAAFQGLIATAKAGLGFETGGYTGDIGTKDVAGVVHGKEFVHTADKTARYRSLFEHIHSGGNPVEFVFKENRDFLRREIARIATDDIMPNIRLFVDDQGRLVQQQIAMDRMMFAARQQHDVQARVGALLDQGVAVNRQIAAADVSALHNEISLLRQEVSDWRQHRSREERGRRHGEDQRQRAQRTNDIVRGRKK